MKAETLDEGGALDEGEMLDEGGAPEWRNIKTMRIGSNRLNINTRMIVGNAIRMTVCMVFMLFVETLCFVTPSLFAS